jgi:hypothetical protein
MVYGKEKVFDADRLIDLLNAFESFTVAAGSARGEMDSLPSGSPHSAADGSNGGNAWQQQNGGGAWNPFGSLIPAPLTAPLAALLGPNAAGNGGGSGSMLGGGWPFGSGSSGSSNGSSSGQVGGGGAPGLGGIGLFGLPANRYDLRQGGDTLDSQGRLREALKFVFSQVRCRGMNEC